MGAEETLRSGIILGRGVQVLRQYWRDLRGEHRNVLTRD